MSLINIVYNMKTTCHCEEHRDAAILSIFEIASPYRPRNDNNLDSNDKKYILKLS